MSDLVEIYQTSSMADAAICKAMLEDAHVPVFARGGHENSIVRAYGLYPLQPFDYQFFVREEDAEFARGLVRVFEAEATNDEPEESSEETPTEPEASGSCFSSWSVRIGICVVLVVIVLCFARMLGISVETIRDWLNYR